MRVERPWWMPVMAAGVMFVGACAPDTSAQRAATVATIEEAPIRVVVESPQEATKAHELVLPGSVEPWETAPLYGRVTGYLDEVRVDIGDEVEAGEHLASIVVPEMRADIDAAVARVAQEKAERELARLTHERLGRLREVNAAAIPRQDVDVAAAQLLVEEAQVGVAEAALARLEAMRTLSRLRAPFTGRITARILDPGALVREGNSPGAEPVVEIARTDRLRLVFEVPEPLNPHLQRGMPAKVRFDAFPAQEVPTVVSRFAGALDPATRSMRAEIDLEDAGGRYRPGMYAAVQIEVASPGSALTVSSRAVRGHGRDRFVLVADGEVLRRRAVKVSADDGRRATIAEGLAGGDLVMIAGSPLARDGSRCTVVRDET